MNFLGWLWRFIFSADICSAGKQMFVFLEMIPCEITNVVRDSTMYGTEAARTINNTVGYKSLHDTILNTQRIGFRLLVYVKPENLFFVFGETVESLQLALSRFSADYGISYPVNNCYGPVYSERNYRYNKCKADPMAVVLCKLVNANVLQEPFGRKQQNGSGDAKYYKVSWSDLQDFQKNSKNFLYHM